MNKMKFLSLALFSLLSALFTIGCGDDSGIVNKNTNSWHPNLTFTSGQTFVYTNDSLLAGGSGHVWTRRRTTDVMGAQITFQGKTCYLVTSTNFDSVTSNTSVIPYYISYDQSAGIYYQYGIGTLINPSQSPTWDVVGNFEVARGTSYDISTINYTVNVPPFGNVTFTGPLTGKIADSTTIQTTSNGESIVCYRIELNASISGAIGGTTIAASIFIDYYLGYGSPTGIVELKLRPFNFTVLGTPVLNEPGFDRKLFNHTP